MTIAPGRHFTSTLWQQDQDPNRADCPDHALQNSHSGNATGCSQTAESSHAGSWQCDLQATPCRRR
eukprot:CAMPEP_0197906620 /NCGR_PEP_ID=MMETSP1439-20131203/63112_1 /TAXON_ID=66791 /ORGANISM="Gonyaulax spinifera, Strain CCMP409" /LENGTH=65 /DNA_ID=CAMNT_0043527995 /DNA_START=64 /DNA_END=257 /DNA_ORIENTATION=-